MMTAFELISDFYGNRRAKRSTVPYMNHIKEGLEIIDILVPTNDTLLKDAFCLHPMVQDTEMLEENILPLMDWAYNDKAKTAALALALEYRMLANSYLCRPETDNYTDGTLKTLLKNYSTHVKILLLADKLQNFKDFKLFHLGKHPRNNELHGYFRRWIRVLKTDSGVLGRCLENIPKAENYS